MKAVFESLVRTVAPRVVTLVVAYLTSLELDVDPQFSVALTGAIFLIAEGAYYLVVRVLETYVSPKFGWLLGLAKQPVYEAPSPVAEDPVEPDVEDEEAGGL